MNNPKSLLDVFYYPDLRAEIKKIKSLIMPYMLPLSKTNGRQIATQIDPKFIEFKSAEDRYKFVQKIANRLYRKIKSDKLNSLSNLEEFKLSKQTFKQALSGDVNDREGAIIKFLQTYYKTMHRKKAFHSKKEFDKKYRGFEISFEVIPINSKFAIVMIKKYMQWKSYLHSTTRKAYAIVGIDDFGNSFIIFIPHGIANSIIRAKQIDWEKIKQRIWGCKINFQIGRFGLIKIDRPLNWNYKGFGNINYITPLIIQNLINEKIYCIKVGNEFFRIINPKDELGLIQSDEIIDQGEIL